MHEARFMVVHKDHSGRTYLPEDYGYSVMGMLENDVEDRLLVFFDRGDGIWQPYGLVDGWLQPTYPFN